MLCAGHGAAAPHPDLNAVILQRSAEDQSIAIYAVRGGWLAEPLHSASPKSPGSHVPRNTFFREYLERAAHSLHRLYLADAPVPGRAEYSQRALWLVARWYSVSREGKSSFATRTGRIAESARLLSRSRQNRKRRGQRPPAAAS